MKAKICPQEPRLLRAAAKPGSEAWPEELRLHAESCPSCQEALKLQQGLRRLARETRPSHPLPEAGGLWWRAELARRWVKDEETARKAERPLLWGRAAALLLGLLAPLPFLASAPGLLAAFLALGLAPLTVFLGWFLLLRD